jgi:hypothetical protein
VFSKAGILAVLNKVHQKLLVPFNNVSSAAYSVPFRKVVQKALCALSLVPRDIPNERIDLPDQQKMETP